MADPGPATLATRRPLAASVGLLLLGHAATIAVGFAIVVAVSRVLDEEALGRWRLAQAVLTYLVVIGDMGLTMLSVREIAKRPSEAWRFAGPVLVLRLGVSMLLAAIAIAVVLAADASADAQLFYTLTFLTVIPNALTLLHVLQGHERLGTFAVARLLITAVAGILGLASLLITGELVALVIWPLVIGFIVDAWLVRVTVSRLGVRLVPGDWTGTVWLLRAAAPFFVGAVAIQLISNADAVIIGTVRGEAQLGIYAAAYLLAGQLLFLSGPVASAIYPRLSHLAASGTGFDRALRRTTGVLGLVVVPLCIGAAIVSDDLVRVMYGERFADAGPLLRILLGMPLVGFYNVAVAQALNAANRQGAVMRVSLLAAAVSVALNVALVPTVGLVGAAIAAVVTELVTGAAYTRAVGPLAGSTPLRAYVVPLGAATPMALVALGSQAAGLPLPVTVIVAASTYVLVVVARPTEAAHTLLRILRGIRGRRGPSAIL